VVGGHPAHPVVAARHPGRDLAVRGSLGNLAVEELSLVVPAKATGNVARSGHVYSVPSATKHSSLPHGSVT